MRRAHYTRIGTVLLAGALLLPTGAMAAVFNVNDTADLPDANLADVLCAAAGGGCTLRAAVQEANDTPGADVIVLPDGDFFLSIAGRGEDAAATGDLDITSEISIVGSAPNRVTISADSLDRVFDVQMGGNLFLASVSVVDGLENANEGGGGIRNRGTLSLQSCDVRNNVSDDGTSGSGGGVSSTGTLVVNDSSINDNRAGTAAGLGGGLFADSGTLTNTVIFWNSVGDTAGIHGAAGVFHNGPVAIRNCTIVDNSGGILGAVAGFVGTPTVRNTIVADNTSTFGGGDCLAVESEGYNLIEDASACTVSGDPTGVQTGVDPGMGTPFQAANGVMVVAPDATGAAIDAGNPAPPDGLGTACEERDIHGYPRSFGGAACDLGAIESGICWPQPIDAGVCRAPTSPPKGLLLLKDNAVDSRDTLVWRWLKGESTDDGDFGIGLSDFDLCIYDDTGLALEARVPAGGTCGASPCWTDVANGLRYKDAAATADGMRVVKMKPGADGQAKIIATGKGAGLRFRPPPWDGTVTVNGVGPTCFEASYSSPLRNETGFYKAKP